VIPYDKSSLERVRCLYTNKMRYTNRRLLYITLGLTATTQAVLYRMGRI